MLHRRSAMSMASRLLRAGLVAVGVLLGACQALPPAMSASLVGFGQDVLAAAAQNFAPQYAASVGNLFLAMAETATGMPFTQQPGTAEDTYGHAEPEAAFDETGGADGDVYTEPYPDGQQAYAGGQQDVYGQQDAYAPQEQDYGQPGGPGIGLQVAVLAQQYSADGQIRLRPVQDGDVLRDGRGNPAAGDKIKVFFAAGCACYVYVIGIDATGYVARIFPGEGPAAALPVTPGAAYLVPEGTTWWGLDENRGVEQIYFIASRGRRRDIEDLLAQVAGPRPSLPANYRAVRQPAIVPLSRGLVQVQSAAPTLVPTEHGAGQPVSPMLFQSTVADADLVITRWFRHE